MSSEGAKMSWMQLATAALGAAGSSEGSAPGDYYAPTFGPVNIGGLNAPPWPFDASLTGQIQTATGIPRGALYAAAAVALVLLLKKRG